MIPTVTVIMPVRNEASFITQSLRAVYKQDYPSELMEVIVVDGDSADDTPHIVRRVASQYRDVETTILHNPDRTVPKSMNVALALVRGEIVVRVDGHAIIARDYVRQCVNYLQESGADNVGGRMCPIGRGCFGKATALATTSRFGVGGSRFHYSNREEFVDTVYLGAWPREVFTVFGSFDEEQVRNQDDEFNYRMCSANGRILLCPRIKSRYFTRNSPYSLARQYFQYGYWKVRVMQKHPAQMKPRHFVPAMMVTVFATLLAASPFSVLAVWGLVGCGALYAVANLTASLVAAGTSWQRIAPVSLAYATLHFSYGLGFLFGLIRFWNRWGKRRRVGVPVLTSTPAETVQST